MDNAIKKIDGWKTIIGLTILLLVVPLAANHGWAIPGDTEIIGKWLVGIGLTHKVAKIGR